MQSISIIVPTYNSERTLEECLQSISSQDYPKNLVELIIADAGSTDKTLEIAKKFGAKILQNPLKTGEAGKAVALKKAKNELIALIDSDNILPTRDWLKEVAEPLSRKEIFGSQPVRFECRKQDSLPTRYFALIGMNDPLMYFLGNYDRFSYLSGKWTGLRLKQRDAGKYIEAELSGESIPTLGANGFILRRTDLLECGVGDYLFDIDIICDLVSRGKNRFALVKNSLVHLYTGSVSTFARKQRRRIRDFAYFQQKGGRRAWRKMNRLGLLKFVLYTVLVFPLLAQMLMGFARKPDSAWLFHFPACWITLIVYGIETIKLKFSPPEIESREKWSQ